MKFLGWNCVGAGSRIGPGCILENSLVLDGAIMRPGLSLREAVVADGARVSRSVSQVVIT